MHFSGDAERNARCVAPNLAYHITQRGTDHQKVFFSVGDRQLYLRLIRENLAEAGVQILAYCLMANHIHLVAVAEREDSLALLFRRVHGQYAQFLNIRRGRSGHLWQARFFSCPLSPAHLWMALRYVEDNPCRAGLTDHPEQYRYSSAAAHLLGAPDPSHILDLDFFVRAGGITTWRELHHRQVLPHALRALRQCTYSGRPFGDDAFLEEMEQTFHRTWRRGLAEKTTQITEICKN